MEAVILAAGLGTRMRPLSADRPKNLLNVAGEPVVHHLLGSLAAAGVKEVVVVVGHGHDRLQTFLGDGGRYGLELEYVQQEKQLGAGHALLQARDHVLGDEILALGADAWYDPRLIHELVADGPALLQVPDARSSRHGIPRVQGGKVVDLVEPEGATGPPSAGAYCLPRRVLDSLEAPAYRLRDAVRRDITTRGPWNAVVAREDEYFDLIEVQDLLACNDRILSGLEGDAGAAPPGVTITGPVRIGKGTELHPGTIVMGPVTIGAGCDIGPGVILQPGTSIRNRVRIEPFSLLRHCCVSSNVTIGSHVRIESAYIDNGARVGAGVRIEGGTGIIVGADAVLGPDASIAPGGVIGREATVAAGRRVDRVPDGGSAV